MYSEFDEQREPGRLKGWRLELEATKKERMKVRIIARSWAPFECALTDTAPCSILLDVQHQDDVLAWRRDLDKQRAKSHQAVIVERREA